MVQLVRIAHHESATSPYDGVSGGSLFTWEVKLSGRKFQGCCFFDFAQSIACAIISVKEAICLCGELVYGQDHS